MQAMVYTAPLTLEMADVEEPVAADGEVIVEVEAVGICGSELEGFATQSPFRVPPLIMGHEFAGRRTDTGERVTVNPLLACGSCDLCLRGARNVCRKRKLIGIQQHGAFAELVAVPENRCVPLPAGMAAEHGALTEPVANAVHAWRLALSQDPGPARVGIIGAGTLGLVTALVVLQSGMADVEITDLSEVRLGFAREAGVPTAGQGLEGEYDVIFDAVGSAATRATSVELLRPGGTAIWIGLHDEDAGFDSRAFIRAEKRVLATFCYHEHDFTAALDVIASIGSTPWIRSVPLSAGVETFEGLMNGDDSSTKTALVPR